MAEWLQQSPSTAGISSSPLGHSTDYNVSNETYIIGVSQ